MRVIRHVKYIAIAPLIKLALMIAPIFSRRDTPPNIINFSGGGSFKTIGDQHVKWMVEFAGLRGGLQVLEIGCGIGRNATALYRRFGEDVFYLGFDPVGFGIEWCRQHFAWLGSSYRFVRVDLYNSFYNPRGKILSDHYVFPCADNECDVVVATSVFTHVRPKEVRRYVAETSRVLKPEGAFYFSAFIIDEMSLDAIARGASDRQFLHRMNEAWIDSRAEPDLAVAYEWSWLVQILLAEGMILELVNPGTWRGVSSAEYQDILVARKKACNA